MTDPLALQVDFLHEQPVHLFQLHPVLIVQLLDLILQLLHVHFEAHFVLVD